MNQLTPSVRITIRGLCLNAFLIGLKLVVGILVASAALIADAVHSISDLFTDVVTLLGIRISSRPADESHAYGHGKYEAIAASLVAVVLVGAGLFITWKAGLALYRHEHNIPGYPVLIVALVSIVSKEWIYQVTRRVALAVKSLVLQANAWHHRSDALSSVAVLLGAIAGLVGWGHGDQVAAMAVGVMIAAVGISTLWRVFLDLVEGSVSGEERRSIVEAINSVPGVKGWHHLRTRLVGREVYMDLHLIVDAKLSLAEGHRICSAVEEAVAQTLERPINIVVHCEPEEDSAAANLDSGNEG
ncbi:cation diffusion facilitator family transporter [Chloroflexota bacterium]